MMMMTMTDGFTLKAVCAKRDLFIPNTTTTVIHSGEQQMYVPRELIDYIYLFRC